LVSRPSDILVLNSSPLLIFIDNNLHDQLSHCEVFYIIGCTSTLVGLLKNCVQPCQSINQSIKMVIKFTCLINNVTTDETLRIQGQAIGKCCKVFQSHSINNEILHIIFFFWQTPVKSCTRHC